MASLYSSHLLSASSLLQLSTKMALKTPPPLFPGFKAGSSQWITECGCSLGFKSYGLVQNHVLNISCAMNMAAGQSDDPEKTKLEQVMDKARKLWDSSPQPVKSFPWIRALDNFIQLILDLVLAVVKYLSVPLLVVTSLSEMSYCAHERKLKLVLFPFFLGTAVAGVLRRTALDISPLLKLTGNIPSSLGECTMLRVLHMDHNMFKGTIESLHSLRAVEEIDLSHNNFSGHIPDDFGRFVFLSKLNLSFNDLEGEVPSAGIFSSASANISLDGNDKLCGGTAVLHLAPCSKKSLSKKNFSFIGKMIISLVGSLLGVCLISYFLFTCCFKKKMKQQSSESLWRDVPFLNISYGELLNTTNGFCSENLIGVGGFGSVYKGIHESLQLPMAVKVFNLERRGASKSFMAECEILRNIRHRNLVKIITACLSVDFQGNDFKALVYEFMSNGSLDNWLHRYPQTGESQRKSLTLAQRLNIVIDVASALDYLHNHSELPVIHCDLKPSNILLDRDMTSHVGDFGLSRIIEEDDVQVSQNHTSSLGIRGTIGYTAPEYGMGSKVSTEGDVFSFGILLLEIFTGKKPTDENLDGLGLHQFVKMALPEKVTEIVDQRLLIEGEEQASRSGIMVRTRIDRVHECLISIFMIGLKCSEELPRERMKINDALKDLHKIKNMLLKYARNNNGA